MHKHKDEHIKKSSTPHDQASTGSVKKEKEPETISADQILTELKEYKDKYIRLYAEFENARKRMERERTEFVKYANEELIGDFLNILDDLKRCVQAAQAQKENNQALLKGIEMVMAHIHEMLKRQGVRPIEALGKPFDPHFHEILMQVESDGHEDPVVLEEFQKGYMYNDKVIRTAKVKIAKKVEKNS